MGIKNNIITEIQDGLKSAEIVFLVEPKITMSQIILMVMKCIWVL